MTASVEMGLLGVIGFVTAMAAAGYIGLWLACRSDRKERTRPTGAGGFLWE